LLEFSWIFDLTAWAGLFALVTMEVVLGIDNLVFIAILSERVPPGQRDKARVIGLALALLLRLCLLSVMSWMVKLTEPVLSFARFSFSGRDFIFIIGGIFLLFKATSELHERLEGVPASQEGKQRYSGFWTVVTQIMALDAVFSLDSIVTAVGIVDHLSIMFLAVTIAIALMIMASKPLNVFINAHPTVVILCLCFLLMIGFSLMVEGLGFHVPKGYLYAAIGFSVLIESANQIARAKQARRQSLRPLRERTAEAILRLMGEKQRLMEGEEEDARASRTFEPVATSIAGEESAMISGLLTLGERSLRTLMTPRSELVWIDLDDDPESVRANLVNAHHSYYPVARGDLDTILGVARSADLLESLRQSGSLKNFHKFRPPTLAPESMDAIRLLKLMRAASGHVVLAVDEFGSISGLLTPVDIFEIIAGEFLDEGEKPDIIEMGDGKLLVQGHTDLHHLEQYLGMEGITPPGADYGTIAGLILDNLGHLPRPEETMLYLNMEITIKKVSARRIEEVIVKIRAPEEQPA
jgi:CBS domain containing-hemolysin-like protein